MFVGLGKGFDVTRDIIGKKFLADEGGAMSFLILPMFILLIVLAGLAIDMYSEETYREDLQDAVDRGGLAAGAPHQGLVPEDVVQAYVDARTFSEVEIDAVVEVEATTTSTRIKVGAGYEMPTIIFSLFEDNSMPVVAGAEVFEGEEDVEISLVLDISGSMARSTSTNTTEKRLAIMRNAAKTFVTAMLDRDNAQKVSISIIPYAGQVNAGSFFDMIVSSPSYPAYANKCVEFTDADFATASLPVGLGRGQSPQFQNFRFEGDYGHEADWGWCPKNSRGVLPLSRDEAVLHAFIDNFRAHDGTGTNVGLKWGLALLDPSTQPLIAALTLPPYNEVVSDFANRPAAYGAARTQKFMVVMTDGNIRYQNRPTTSYLNTTAWQDYWGSGPIPGSNGTSTNLLSRYASSRSTLTSSTARTLDENLRSQQFLSVCDIARQKGINVFTIGFDITTTQDAYNEMRDCATVPANFFDVDGADLYAAFSQITVFIRKLQLIQ